MYKAGLDKFNVLTGDLVRNGKGDYTITPYTLRDGSKWDKTTDNFYQNHNILSATWTPSSHSFTRMQRATRSLTSSARRDSPSIPTAWYTIPTTRMSTGMLSAD